MSSSHFHLKLYFLANLGWDAPLIEALFLNVRDESFKLNLYAQDLRRAKLTPLFRDWIPKDCTAALLSGQQLVELTVPGVARTRYWVSGLFASPEVWREVEILDPAIKWPKSFARREGDWISVFKADVMGNYTIEKLKSEFEMHGVSKTSIRGAGMFTFSLIQYPNSGLDGNVPSLRVKAEFNQEWSCIDVHYYEKSKGPGSGLLCTFQNTRNRHWPWGILELPNGTGDAYDNPGFDLTTFHAAIARGIREFKERYVTRVAQYFEASIQKKKKTRDKSPRRT
jgi:hypothetical protein